MQPVTIGDVLAAARRVQHAPPRRRLVVCRALIARAEAADRWRMQCGRCHPRFGNGTLEAAAVVARRHSAEDQGQGFLRCVALVITCLLEDGSDALTGLSQPLD